MKNRIRRLREERGWSQEELGRRVDVTRQTIYFIETGRFDPSLPLAMKLGRVFNQRVEEMFELDR